MVEPVTDVEALISWLDDVGHNHSSGSVYANAATALRTLQERVAELEAQIAGTNPNFGDLWWVDDDPELGHDDAYEAFEYGNGGGPEPGIVQLQRARRLPNVWATRIVLTRDEDGEPDDTEVRCFHTKAEAEARLKGADQ